MENGKWEMGRVSHLIYHMTASETCQVYKKKSRKINKVNINGRFQMKNAHIFNHENPPEWIIKKKRSMPLF